MSLLAVRIAAPLRLPCSTFAGPTPEFQPKRHKMRKTQVVASGIKPELSDYSQCPRDEGSQTDRKKLCYLDQLPDF